MINIKLICTIFYLLEKKPTGFDGFFFIMIRKNVLHEISYIKCLTEMSCTKCHTWQLAENQILHNIYFYTLTLLLYSDNIF